MLAGEDHCLSILRAQLAAARLTARELSGVGFFLNFEVPTKCSPTERRNFEITDVTLEVEGVRNGAGVALFVRDGYLAMLEGFTFDDDWVAYRNGDTRDMDLASQQWRSGG
jgi:hypothetical protein